MSVRCGVIHHAELVLRVHYHPTAHAETSVVELLTWDGVTAFSTGPAPVGAALSPAAALALDNGIQLDVAAQLDRALAKLRAEMLQAWRASR